MHGWRKIPQAAEYYGVSVRTMRSWLKAGFPHSRLPSGTILIEIERGDEYLRQFDVARQAEKIVDELTEGLM